MDTANEFGNDTAAGVRNDNATAGADETTTTAGSAYDLRTIRSVRVNTVLIGEGRRACNPEQARMIADSMAEVGLINPITVTPAQTQAGLGTSEIGATVKLVAGLHRLEAAKLLGWTHIDAVTVAADRIDDRLREIAENLCRGELTVLEKAELVDEWHRLISEKVGQVARPGGPQPNDQGISRAANVLGLTRERVRRSKVIAGISPEAKAAAKAAYLSDNQAALLEIAKQPTPEAQVEKVRERAVRKHGRDATPAHNSTASIAEHLHSNFEERAPGCAETSKVDPETRDPETASTQQERAYTDLTTEWQNAVAFRRACAKAPVAARDKFHAEVVRGYCE